MPRSADTGSDAKENNYAVRDSVYGPANGKMHATVAVCNIPNDCHKEFVDVSATVRHFQRIPPKLSDTMKILRMQRIVQYIRYFLRIL